MKRGTTLFRALALTTAGIGVVLLGKEFLAPRPDLAVLGTVGAFSLIDQDGKPFRRADLLGRLSVAAFIFTECGGQCPMMSRQMARIQALVPPEAGLQLLSISVDPGHDTPAVLSSYARRYGAQPDRWRFLTGKPEVIYRLAQKGFRLAADGRTSDAITHSSRLVLLDRQIRIRGYYEGTDEAAVRQLLKDLHRL